MPSGGSGAAYPFGSPMPGANFGGSNQAVPTAAGSSTPAVGGATNPFIPQSITGSSVPGPTSALNPSATLGFDPNTAADVSAQYGVGGPGGNSTNSGTATDPANINQTAFINSMHAAGIGPGVAQLLYSFLQSGAGFSQESMQAMIQALQPQVQQGQAQLQEQFSSLGMGESSPAAYAQASFDSQVQGQYGQIFSQMYEQSVQNYMNVLLGGKGSPQQSGSQTFANIASGITSLASIGKPPSS